MLEYNANVVPLGQVQDGSTTAKFLSLFNGSTRVRKTVTVLQQIQMKFNWTSLFTKVTQVAKMFSEISSK